MWTVSFFALVGLSIRRNIDKILKLLYKIKNLGNKEL